MIPAKICGTDRQAAEEIFKISDLDTLSSLAQLLVMRFGLTLLVERQKNTIQDVVGLFS